MIINPEKPHWNLIHHQQSYFMKCLFLVLFSSVAVAQTSGSMPVVSSSLRDSTLEVCSTIQLYDFYYSAKQADSFVKQSNASYTWTDQIKKKRFRNRTFTELILKGHKPDERFDDYTLIGSGRLEEVNSEGTW
jgi:hypothetical protein